MADRLLLDAEPLQRECVAVAYYYASGRDRISSRLLKSYEFACLFLSKVVLQLFCC